MTAESFATQLEAHRDFRVLRRVPPVEQWQLAKPANDVVRGVVVDCETTGLGDDDEVIELAIVPFDYCRTTGNVVAVHQPFASFCEPQKPISAESQRIHGITQEMVAGHTITDADVATAVGGAKLVGAFNSYFDRRMTAKTWPLLDSICWGCAYQDVDWPSLGYETGKLQYLLMKMGFFFDGHRAVDDALATLFLMTQPGVMPSLLENARKPLYKVTLRNTPYSAKDAIKARGGYQWDDRHPAGKCWWKCVSNVDEEIAWSREALGHNPLITPLPLAARHSSRVVDL